MSEVTKVAVIKKRTEFTIRRGDVEIEAVVDFTTDKVTLNTKNGTQEFVFKHTNSKNLENVGQAIAFAGSILNNYIEENRRTVESSNRVATA